MRPHAPVNGSTGALWITGTPCACNLWISCLDGGDLVGRGQDFKSRLGDVRLARRQGHDAPAGLLERLRVRVVRARLQAGHVPALEAAGVLPEGEGGELRPVEPEHDGLPAVTVAEHRQRLRRAWPAEARPRLAEQFVKVNLLGEPRLGTCVDVERAEPLDRARVAGDDLPGGREKPGTFLQERRAEVPVVKDLHLLRQVAEVLELVADGQPVRARKGRDRGGHADLGREQLRLVHVPLDADRAVGAVADVDGHEVGRDVGDLAVQAERGVPLGVRGAVVLKAAAGEQLVKPFEPAEPAPVHEVDERRVDRAVGDGRSPAEGEPLVPPLPQAHAPGRHDRERQRPVIDLDQVDALPPAAPERPLGHRPGRSVPVASRPRIAKLSTQRSCAASVSVCVGMSSSSFGRSVIPCGRSIIPGGRTGPAKRTRTIRLTRSGAAFSLDFRWPNRTRSRGVNPMPAAIPSRGPRPLRRDFVKTARRRRPARDGSDRQLRPGIAPSRPPSRGSTDRSTERSEGANLLPLRPPSPFPGQQQLGDRRADGSAT